MEKKMRRRKGERWGGGRPVAGKGRGPPASPAGTGTGTAL
jgi:hypothetical protein